MNFRHAEEDGWNTQVKLCSCDSQKTAKQSRDFYKKEVLNTNNSKQFSRSFFQPFSTYFRRKWKFLNKLIFLITCLKRIFFISLKRESRTIVRRQLRNSQVNH